MRKQEKTNRENSKAKLLQFYPLILEGMKDYFSESLELTRFGGHLQSRERRCLHDQETQSVQGGVPREPGAAVEEGAKLVGLSREFGPSPQTIINWVRQADLDEGRPVAGATSAEREELRRARREIRRLREERDILAKAAAWFARETGSITRGCSNS